MNFANGLKRIASEVNVGLKIFKRSVGLKSACTGPGPVSGALKHNNVILNSLTKTENFCYSFPQSELGIKKNIIDPCERIKINFELPIRNSISTSLNLPSYIENEIKEPSNDSITEKRAFANMYIVRRKKMRRHKQKKFIKKHKIEIQQKAFLKKQKNENELQLSLKNIFKEAESFSAEQYVDETLKKVNWKRPITRVKGYLAPKWVVDKYLEEKEYRENIQKRIEECSK